MNTKDSSCVSNLHNDQRGIMAIVVTVIILIAVSITVISMSVLARREERQSINSVMSIQATYAVESGINDALEHIKKGGGITSGSCKSLVDSDDTLGSDYTPIISMPSELASIASVNLGGYSASSSYPCVSVNYSPDSLKFSEITKDEAAVSYVTVADLTADAGTKLLVSWESSDNTSDFRTCPSLFTNADGWNSTSIIKLDIVRKLGSGQTINRATLIDNSYTLYLIPCVTFGDYSPTAHTLSVSVLASTGHGGYLANRAAIIDTKCDSAASHTATTSSPLRCNAIITLGATPTNSMAIRLHPIYGNVRAEVKVFDSSDGSNTSPLAIVGAQKSVDVTGKSNDVLKRKEIRIGPGSGITRYLYAIDVSGPLCKRIMPTIENNVLTYSDDFSGVEAYDKTACTTTL